MQNEALLHDSEPVFPLRDDTSRESWQSASSGSRSTILAPAAKATTEVVGSVPNRINSDGTLCAGDFVQDATLRGPDYLGENYEFLRKLGDGAFGEVRLSIHRKTGVKRAMKIMAKVDCNSKVLANEVDIIKDLSHPNILKVHEFFQDAYNYYIVMECCDGGELFDQIIKRSKLSEEESADIVEQVLTALCYLHGKSICHRDIKPENILFSQPPSERSGTVKLIDFGLATRIRNKRVTGRFGTSYYIAPEVIRCSSSGYNEKCDIWSLGVILFTLLLGYPPFLADNDQLIMAEVLKGFHPSKFHDSKLSYEARDLIYKMLLEDPEIRPSASELLNHPFILSKSVRGQLKASRFGRLGSLKVFNHEQKLANAVMFYISSKLITEVELQEFVELFRRLDLDGNGLLDRNELETGIHTLRPELCKSTISELADIILTADFDANGAIDFDEFVASLFGRVALISEQRLKSAYSLFDINGDGLITVSELSQTLPNLADWEQVIAAHHNRGDGTLRYDEFKQIVSSGDFMLRRSSFTKRDDGQLNKTI